MRQTSIRIASNFHTQSTKMSVSRAVQERKSCRQFIKDKPVPDDVLKSLIEQASRAPSGGNVQPWRVHVVSGKVRDELVSYLKDKEISGTEYDIYPPELDDPYKSRRAKVGNDMYQILGIGRKDTKAKLKHVQRNFTFFDAPAGLFFTIDSNVNNPPQWSDIGMFMQTFMLLATEQGIATCAQEAWANHAKNVKDFLGVPEDHILFAGIAVGYEDTSAPINKLRTERASLSEFVTFHQGRGKL